MHIILFFFSSRRRHTRWNCDWSSDVCSSDLGAPGTSGSGGRSECACRGKGLQGALRDVPRPAERAQDRGGAGNVSGAAGTLQRHGGDGRRRVGVVLESGKWNSTVGDAGVQRAAYGKTDLAGGRSGEERGQDTRIREKRARGRREHSDGDGDAGEPAGKIKEEIVRLSDLFGGLSTLAGAAQFRKSPRP